jgi:tetratricopeptide (TPR) repeat protein
MSVLFIDRREDFEWVDRQWERNTREAAGALVVLSGTAGVGKTSLALAWLHRRAGEFPDGQLYVDLGGYSPVGAAAPVDVLGTLLRALGVLPEAVPVSTAERTALLRTVTHGRKIAILLDNALSAAQVRILAVRATDCVTFVTTRGALSGLAMDGARLYRLEPWGAETGVELMRRMLGEERVGAEPQAALDVARLCGGLPLAVGVASAKLAGRPHWPISRLAETLALAGDARRLEVLALDADDALTPVLDSSYRSLADHDAALYRLLGMCPVSFFDRDAVAAVLGCPPPDGEQRLDALVDANLLQNLGGRVRFHDLVRLHAAQSAALESTPGERRETLLRLSEFYLRATTRAEEILTPTHRILEREYQFPAPDEPSFDDAQAALDWLEAQRTNLMGVLRACAEQELHAMVWQLAEAMWPLFLRLRYAQDRLEAQLLGLDAARAQGSAAAEGIFLTSLAGTLGDAGRLEESVTYNRQAVDLYEAGGDQRGLAQAYNGMAKDLLKLGDLRQAEEFFTRALRLREQAGYQRGAFLSHQGLGRVALATGDFERAVDHLQHAYQGLDALGDHYDAAWSSALLARAECARGQAGQALKILASALARMTEIGSRFGEAWVYEITGEVHESTGDVTLARQDYAAAFERLGAADPAARDRVRARLIELGGDPADLSPRQSSAQNDLIS